MQGLYKKALEIRESQRYLRLLREDELGEDDDLDISPDERERILAQIDSVVEGSRIRIGPDTFVVKPKRPGAVLPLVVNLLAVVLMVAGAYVLVQWFNNREEVASTETSTLTSAEGRLLTALKEESEQLLSQKEREIAQIQGQLSDLNTEREQLAEQSATQLQEREDALRSEFESVLEAERQRLTDGGLSQDEIDRQIADFEASQRTQYDSDLEAARQQAAAELAQREETLNTLLTDVQQALSAAEQERVDLQEELANQEARLVQEFQTETAELEQERSAALQQLQQLSEQQEREELVLDQIVSFYNTARSQIVGAEYPAALETLDALKGYLGDRSVMELPAVSRRLQVELFLVDSLRSLVADEAEKANPDTQSLVESAALVAQVADLVEAADESFSAASYEQAQQLYESALERIPAVQVGLNRLNEIRAFFEAEETAEVAGLIELGNSYYLEDQFDRAAAEYDRALSALPAYDAELLSRILDAGYQLRTTRELDELRSVRAELEQLQITLAARNRTIEDLQAQISDLENREVSLVEEVSALELAVAALETSAAELESDDATAPRDPDPELVADLGAAQDTINGLRAELATLKADAEAVQALLAARDDQLQSRISELTVAQTGLSAARAELELVKADLEAARTTGAETAGTLEDTDADLAELRQSLSSTGSDLAQARDELDQTKAQLANATTQLERLSEMEAEVVRLTAELSTSSDLVATLEESAAELTTELDSAIAERDTARTDLAGTRSQLSAATAEVAYLKPYEGSYNEQQALLSDIAAYQERFSSSSSTASPDGVSALKLLETKLLILRIVDSEPIRSEHPDLFDDLNTYLEALVTEQREAAVIETFGKIETMLAEILAGETVPGAEITDPLESESPSAYSSILDRIRTIANPDER